MDKAIVIDRGELANRLGVRREQLYFEVQQVDNVVRFQILIDGKDLTPTQTAIAMAFIESHGPLKMLGAIGVNISN